MTNGTIAQQLNRFANKDGDLHYLQPKIKDYSRDEKMRVVENLLAGDDPEMAVKDAKGYVAPKEEYESL